MKPIVFFDLETTGTDVQKDRIVEIAIIKIDGDQQIEYSTRVNPGIPIPKTASDVHGITDDLVKEYPSFNMIAQQVFNMFDGCDIGGYNSNTFDIPMLYNELLRRGLQLDLSASSFLDACVIFKRMESRTLTAAVKFYLDNDHEGAHGALADVRATIEVLKAQKERYRDLSNLSIQELALYCNYDKPRADLSGNFAIENGEYMMNFGKHKGTKAKECKSYLSWMLQQDFMPDTKAIIVKILAAK